MFLGNYPCASFGKGLTGFRGVALVWRRRRSRKTLKEHSGGAGDMLKIRNGLSVFGSGQQVLSARHVLLQQRWGSQADSLDDARSPGVQKVLKGLNKAYRLDLATGHTSIHEGVALRVKGNTIYITPAETVSLKSVSKKDAVK